MTDRTLVRRLLWFAGLWLAGVLSLLAVSAILKLLIPS